MENQVTISTIIFIVSLIVPGVIYKRFYFSGPFSKQFGSGLFADRLITSIFWGIFVQIITFLLFSKLLNFSFADISTNIGTDYTSLMKNEMPREPKEHIAYFLYYLLSTIFIAATLGFITHQFIRLFKIDVHFSAFRFSNHWHYYFRGDILATKEFKDSGKGKIISTTVDVLITDESNNSKMLTGLLSQYAISEKTGQLETIYLTKAAKFIGGTNNTKAIPGQMMVIPYDKVIDMNIRYNREEIDKDKQANIRYNAITFVGFTLAIIIFIYPWYLNLPILNKIGLIVTTSIAWLFLIVVLANPFQTKANAKLNTAGMVACIIMACIFIFLTLSLLRFMNF